MLLCALDMMTPTHQTTGIWRHPQADPEQYRNIDFWIRHARLLEDAGFDALFFADVAGVYDVFDGSGRTAIRAGMQYPLLDPLLAVSALAAATSTLGFGVTASVSYEQPYLLARKFATLDHLTRGRIAWNIVTSYQRSAMQNLGASDVLPHDQRYDRADEFMEVVYRLWEGSIEPEALLADVGKNVYLDPDRVHGADHNGTHFTVPGPALTLPGPQGTPFLFQAGSSPRGLDFAATHAEALFFSGTSPQNVRQLTDAVRDRLEANGRPQESVRTITSVTVIAGRTTPPHGPGTRTTRGMWTRTPRWPSSPGGPGWTWPSSPRTTCSRTWRSRATGRRCSPSPPWTRTATGPCGTWRPTWRSAPADR